MRVIIELDITREEGMNASADNVLEALSDELDNVATELSVENDAGQESTWSIEVVNIDRRK
jgi:hypothetical protein